MAGNVWSSEKVLRVECSRHASHDDTLVRNAEKRSTRGTGMTVDVHFQKTLFCEVNPNENVLDKTPAK
jgi:hypothetical protein